MPGGADAWATPTCILVWRWLALVFGIFVGGLQVRMLITGQPTSLLWKAEPMKQHFGKVPGTLLHLVSYCLLPIVAGVILIST